MATKTTDCNVTTIGDNQKDYISFEDLVVGQVIKIQERELLIFKADDKTYEFIQRVKGVDMRSWEIDTSPPPKPVYEKKEEKTLEMSTDEEKVETS